MNRTTILIIKIYSTYLLKWCTTIHKNYPVPLQNDYKKQQHQIKRSKKFDDFFDLVVRDNNKTLHKKLISNGYKYQ